MARLLRLFLAVDVPDLLRPQLARMQGQLTHARVTKVEQMHITLRFMGKTPEASLPELRRRLSEIAWPPFELALDGVGTFPEGAGPSHARVLWLGIRGADGLAALKTAIDQRLDGCGPPDDKPGFSPHLTLARFSRRPDESLTRFLEAYRTYRSESWQVSAFVLYQSTLSQAGSRHDVVASYPLVGLAASPGVARSPGR